MIPYENLNELKKVATDSKYYNDLPKGFREQVEKFNLAVEIIKELNLDTRYKDQSKLMIKLAAIHHDDFTEWVKTAVDYFEGTVIPMTWAVMQGLILGREQNELELEYLRADDQLANYICELIGAFSGRVTNYYGAINDFCFNNCDPHIHEKLEQISILGDWGHLPEPTYDWSFADCAAF